MEDTVVLITGGAKGIGRATARAFLAQGARVALADSAAKELEETASGLEAQYPDRVLAVPADVRNWEGVQGMMERVLERFGRIDVLDNNAGVAFAGEVELQSREEIDRMIDVNVKGVVYAARLALPIMKRQGGGKIINIASGAGKSGIPGISVYSATKFAVVGFTEALAREVAPEGIEVFAVCPGAVATDMQVEVSGGYYGMKPEKIAESILKVAGSRPPIAPGECLEVYS